MIHVNDIASWRVVATAAVRLRQELRLPWPRDVEQAVARLSLSEALGSPWPALVAMVGGASSGKSTLFDNLLGGRLVSRITARGHATLGPILAVHEFRRSQVDTLFTTGRFLMGFRRLDVELDDNVTGAADSVSVVFHSLDTLRDVLLFDLPDFTSGAAAAEGDVALALLPWFDRIIVVLDHERWFDRQSISTLRAHSIRFDQERWVVFNQTQEVALTDAERNALAEPLSKLSARGASFLEFRRGRGLCRFPPAVFDEMLGFAAARPPDRHRGLHRFAAEAVNEALNQNEERVARLVELRRSLEAVLDRSVPDRTSCMTALMTSDERRQAEWLSRVLRIHETKRWLSDQARRLTVALKQMPVVGALLMPGHQPSNSSLPAEADRIALGNAFAERVLERHRQELRRVVRASAFWDEVRRWTGLEPSAHQGDEVTCSRPAIEDAVRELDVAIRRWTERVERECEGLGVHAKGALGVGAIALIVVLIAVPGPVTALTMVAAKGAIAAGLTQLLTAAGAGALLGRPLTRLATLAQEKLIGSVEFNAVQAAVGVMRTRLSAACGELNERALAEAEALALPSDDPLCAALEQCRAEGEGMG